MAADTAAELATSARHRFAQTMSTAVTAARTAPFVARDVEEVYDAIGVAPSKTCWPGSPGASRRR